MLELLARFFRRGPAFPAPVSVGPPASEPAVAAQPAEIDNGVGHLQAALLPDRPHCNGEPVPRWPEHGAALLVATPEALLETQADLIGRLRDISPLGAADFDRLLLPTFRRYAAWVHLLPASEYHHHFGAGGLLRHGFEVALHAARMAEGKHVGVDLPPSTRARYEVRWRVAAMLGGLLHDLGKPLVDCGATDPDRTMTWPAHAGDLYSWLKTNNLTHYRIYWRSGARHERHKPVGTAVTREIIGGDLLAWLSDEPSQEVMTLLMMAIAGTPSTGNVMSMVVSKADAMSVEADLKRLAQRTQATAAGGTHSAAGLIMAQLRKMVEGNRITVNKPGGLIWVVGDGCYGAFPALVEAVVAQMKRDEIPSFPASRSDIAELLVETGFVEPCAADTADGRQRSLTWDVRIHVKRGEETTVSAPIKALRFADAKMVFGSVPPPAPADGTVRSPFLSNDDAKAIAEEVAVDSTPQTAASARGTTETDAETAAPAAVAQGAEGQGGAPAVPVAAGEGVADASDPVEEPSDGDAGPHIDDRRNRRDVAAERRFAAEQEQKRGQADLRDLIKKVSKMSLCGPACAEMLRGIYRGNLVYGTDYIDTSDGLAIAYPKAFENLGMPPEDILAGAAENRWVVVEQGSERKVIERTFPDGHRRKCVVFAGEMAQAWTALAADHPEVLEVRDPPPPPPPPAPAPAQSAAPARPAPRPDARPRSNAGERDAEGGQVSQERRPPPREPAAPARPVRTRPEEPVRRASPAPPAPPAATAPKPEVPEAREERRDQARQRKLDRPAIGAQPAPAAGSGAPRQNAQQAPAPAPASSPGSDRTGPRSISCSVTSELTPELVANINATFVMVAELMVRSGNGQYDLSRPEDLKAVMRYLVTEAKVRAAPLLTALTTEDNPALLLKMPTNMTIKEIKAVRLNPDYRRPRWLVERLEQGSNA